MSFTQFTNLDFNTLRAQIQDYLRSNSNFSDFDFEGSNFSILIDTLAYNSYITAYNTNMAVNESFIDSATLRENVVSLARNIGYVPRSTKSAILLSSEVLTACSSCSLANCNATFCLSSYIMLPVWYISFNFSTLSKALLLPIFSTVLSSP